ncbi:MAG: sulfatase-like hydrolase/transferase [Planctomycetes bacterium]|nr:sulfatase-like hydrolase/transferase [Planctomycetota bacterium]
MQPGIIYSRRLQALVPAAISVVGLVALFAAAGLPAAAAPPNIVLIFADDLGVNDLGCYGRTEHETPRLDALAAEGMRFTCAYTAQPICSPSRAALMTGKCPARLHLTNFLHGRADTASQRLLQPVTEGQLPLEETTLAEWLRGVGYATGIFGKWHLGGVGFGPAEQGFEVVMTPPQDTRPGEADGGKGEYAITKAATEFIAANRDRPFFCYVPHNNPHIPLAARQALVDKYATTFHPTYAAMIETLDDAVGRLVRTIDDLGLAANTIIIFTSDNGGLHSPEPAGVPATHNTPYRAGKGFLYEGGLREPLIIRWPGVIRPGSTVDTPVVLTDLVPTLLEAAGIDVAKTVGPLDGTSILGLLEGGSLPERPLFWHFPNYTNQGGRPAGAMRQGNWKLIEQFEDGGLELYDLASDIGEARNVAAEQGERASAMQSELAAWRTRVGAQMGRPNPAFDPAIHNQLYIDHDPSRITARATAAAIDPSWAAWRKQMAAVAGKKPPVTPSIGDVRLLAKDAIVHGKKLRYEPASNKNVLGFWTDPVDWAEWRFTAPAAGLYEVEVQQGCGQGSGGATVDVEVAGATLPFTVVDTGHFQQLVQVSVGTVELAAGEHTLALKPRSKPGAAVMDVRRVVLRPAAP